MRTGTPAQNDRKKSHRLSAAWLVIRVILLDELAFAAEIPADLKEPASSALTASGVRIGRIYVRITGLARHAEWHRTRVVEFATLASVGANDAAFPDLSCLCGRRARCGCNVNLRVPIEQIAAAARGNIQRIEWHRATDSTPCRGRTLSKWPFKRGLNTSAPFIACRIATSKRLGDSVETKWLADEYHVRFGLAGVVLIE